MERQRGESLRIVKQLPISCRQQTEDVTIPVDSQLPLAATHLFYVVNKQFKGKCQLRDRNEAAPNISSLFTRTTRPSCQASDGHSE